MIENFDFCLITSNVYFEENLIPYKIKDKFTIQRADAVHINIFRSEMAAATNHLRLRNFLDYDTAPFILNQDGDLIPAPAPRWWVVNFSGNIDYTEALNMAGQLTQPKLKFGLQGAIGNEDDHFSSRYISLQRHEVDGICTESWIPHRPRLVSKKTLSDLRFYFEKLDEVAVYRQTKYGMKLFLDAMKLEIHTTLKTLSYFSVIECLVTRKTCTSIAKQIQHNIKPILALSEAPPDISHYFGEVEYIKLWDTLYDIRSLIAHGSELKLKPFVKSLSNVNLFLEAIIIEVAKIALSEPNFVKTLRNTKYQCDIDKPRI